MKKYYTDEEMAEIERHFGAKAQPRKAKIELWTIIELMMLVVVLALAIIYKLGE